MRRLGVEDAGTRLPGVLSGGEQQRLAVARALINRPQLLLADEPTGNLDESSGHEVLQLLRAVADGSNSVLLVTHDREAARLADRVLTLRDGRLAE
jgi:putative ABC transport system ATP-binding protein